MSRLVNMGMVLARTSQGLTVQPVLLMMKAHGCHMTDDAIIPRATLGPGSLLTSVSLWELPEPSSEHECRGSASPADAGRAAWTVGHLPWDLLAQPWSSWYDSESGKGPRLDLMGTPLCRFPLVPRAPGSGRRLVLEGP